MSAAGSMGARAARALIWQYGSTIGGRLLTMVAIAILARLLSPDDFGLLGFAVLFTGLLDVLRDFGLGQALVLSKDEDELAVRNTVFRWGVLIGAGLWLVAIGLGPIAVAFFNEPRVQSLLMVMGSTFFIRSLALTHYAVAQKHLDFRARTAAELSNTGMRGLSGVVMALLGFGVWALVLSAVVGAVAFVTVMWVMVPWRPQLRGPRVPVRGLLAFGGVLTLLDIAAAVLYSIDAAVIGRMIGQAALGVYTIGLRLPELVVLNLSVALGSVLFPAFAAVDRSELRHAFLMALRFTMMLALPLAVGLVVMAEPVTIGLFGEKWAGAVDVTRILCIYAFSYAVGIPAGTVYKAMGRAGLLLMLAIPQIVLVLIGSILMAPHGLEAVASVIAGVTLLFFIIGLIIVPRMIPVRYPEMWGYCRPIVVAAAVTGAVLFVLERSLDLPWLEIVLALVVGGPVYFGTLWFIARDQLLYIARKVAPGRFSEPRDAQAPDAAPL